MIDENIIKEIINKIRVKSKAKKIYLFGSYAYGIPDENSDLDILIIKDKIDNKMKEILDIEKEIISSEYSVDIMLITEEEFIKKQNEGWKIFEDIVNKGILIND